MKLGTGYYSLMRIGQRLIAADRRLDRLKALYSEAHEMIQARAYERLMARVNRQQEVLRLREEGVKFRVIALKFGVSRQRAIQIYQEAKKKAQPLGLLSNGSSHRKKS